MKTLKILFFLLISAAMLACGSIPRTMGPYKEAEARDGSQQSSKNTAVQQPQPTQLQPQTKPAAQQPTAQQPQSQPQEDNKKYDARAETFSMISITDAPKLKTYNVVIGSFSIEENAKRLKKSFQPQYEPIIVINEKGMFRVIIASYDTYNEAKDKILAEFHDGWILVQKR